MTTRAKHSIYGLLLGVIVCLSMIASGKVVDLSFVHVALYYSSLMFILQEYIFINILKPKNPKVVWVFGKLGINILTPLVICFTLFLTYIVFMGADTTVLMGMLGMHGAALGMYSGTVVIITNDYIFYPGGEASISEVEEFKLKGKYILMKAKGSTRRLHGGKVQLDTLLDWYNLNKI